METKPLRADAERNRQRLLDAAADLFVERGFDVSLVEIAERAGVGVATAYRRFPEKEQLVDELFDRQLGVVVSSAEEGLEADDPWEGFAGTLERILTHLAENRALKQIISGELRTTERQNRMRAELYPVMAQLVARAQASGDLRPDFVTTDVPLLNVALAASLQASEPVVPGYWRRQLAFVLDGLRTRRDGPSPLPVPGLDRDQTETIMTAPNALRP